MSRLPPLNALRAFEAAARLGSFVRAAEELAVTPAAISQQIRLLEADLGVVLFRRLPRGLVVTEAARRAMPGLAQGFAHLRRAVESARGDVLAGPLVVSAIPSFAARWVIPRLAGFIAAYPEIEITLRAELRSVDFVRESIDLGLRYGRGHYPGLDARLLLTENVFPVCAPSLLAGPKPLRRLEDLRHHTLLHDRQLANEEFSLYWHHWLRDAGVSDIDGDRGPGFTDSTLMLEMARRGAGVALGRSGLCADDLAEGRLVRPFAISRPAEYSYFVVLPEGHAGKARVRAFLDWIEAEAARSRLVTAAA
ncbi:MAG: transcriptional regulator GcvA [Geminicoccaceae bacterium]